MLNKVLKKLYARKLSDFPICKNCGEMIKKHGNSRCERCIKFFKETGTNYVNTGKESTEPMVVMGKENTKGKPKKVRRKKSNLGTKNLQTKKITKKQTGGTSTVQSN